MSEVLMGSIFQMNADIPWESAAPGIQRQVYGYDDKIMLVKVKFERDAVGSLHRHFHSQVTYIESGVFELTIGDKTVILKKETVITCLLMYFMAVFAWNPACSWMCLVR